MLRILILLSTILLSYSCGIKPINEKPVHVEPDLDEPVDEMEELLNEKQPKKVFKRLKKREKQYQMEIGASYDSVSFTEDLDGSTEVNGKMIGTSPFMNIYTDIDHDFSLMGFAKLGLFGEAEFNQTTNVYKTKNTITFGAHFIHSSWDRNIKPILGIEREELSYVSADKSLDLSTVNVFDQISGTKGLFWNGLLGANYHTYLFDQNTIWTLIAGFSLLGESQNSKGELEGDLNAFKGYGAIRTDLNDDFFIGGNVLYSSIKGVRTTTFTSWSLFGGIRL